MCNGSFIVKRKPHAKIINLLVAKAEQYKYVEYNSDDTYSARQEIYKAKLDLLNKTTFNKFLFERGEYSVIYYNNSDSFLIS